MLFTLRRALRSVAQTPLATGVIVLCIGLGVGPTTTVFTWTEHLVRRPLPAVRSFDRLVSIVTRADGREESVSYPDYLDWRDSVRGVSALAAFGVGQFGLRAAAEPPDASESTWGVLVTDNYFDVLGVRAVAGRTFLTGESSTQGEAAYVVVSHALARRRFGGDASAIGRGIRINGVPFTVVGVTPASFTGTFAGLSFDFWVPVTMHPHLGGDADALTGRDRRWLQTIGRLRDGASLAQARTELQALSVGLAGTYRENERREAFVKPLDTGAARRLETLFAVLLGVTTFVAVIVCTNVANLLLLRGAGRRYEIGMLLALGASRRQIVCQLLTEAALLAALGGGVGLVLARWCQTLLPALMPSSPLPLALTAESDLRTGLFALVLSAAMVSVFGLLPAISAVRGAVLPNLRTARGGMTRSSTRLRAALVKVQIGLSLAALASAGAFLRVNSSLAAIDRGLRQPQEVLLVSTDLDQAGYHTPQERRTAAERLLGRVRALPDTHAAALATFVPLGFTGYTTVRASVPAYVPKTGESMAVLANYVSSDYFTTLGIPLLDGRGIDDRDTDASAPVVVVNAAFVQRYLQNLAVIGSRVDLGTRTLTVIGVAADGKYRFDALDQPSPPLVYFAYAQASRASLTLHVRTKGPPQSLVPQIRQAFADVHPSLPLNSPTTLDEYTSLPLFPVRLGTAVLSSLGGIALLLACAGLYGVVAFRVTQRWNELAVRLALGATPSSLMRLIVGDGLRNAAGGLALGVILAIVAIRMIASRLPRVQAVDPAVLLGATGLLGTVALLAAVLPALRAWWVNPASVLRGE